MVINKWTSVVLTLCLCVCLAVPVSLTAGSPDAQVSNKNWDMYEKGIRYLAKEDFEPALVIFQELKARNVAVIDTYLALVGTYSRMGSPEKTVAAVNELIRRFPKAVRRLSKPGRQNSYYSQIYLILGLAEMKAGHHNKAIEAFRLILESDNHEQTFSYQTRQIFPLSALKRPELNALVRVQLGAVYMAAGDREAAMKQYRILEKIAPARASELLEIINRKS